jgi:hypothetical protein
VAPQRLALIAHDNKKVDFVAWATYNRETLAQFDLVATRHTARLVRDKVGLEIAELLSGPEGGDAQIAPSTRCSSSWIRCGRSRMTLISALCFACAMSTMCRSRPTSARRI